MGTATYLCLALLLVFVEVNCELSDSCLYCIQKARNGQHLIGKCRGGICGPYLISHPYWIDCGEPGEDYESCAKEKECSETCVRAYMDRYGEYCTGGKTPQCEDYARIHEGGPNGCKFPATLGFWKKVQPCYNSLNGLLTII